MKVLLIPDRYVQNCVHKTDCDWFTSPNHQPWFLAKQVNVDRKQEPNRRFGSCCK